MLSRREFLRLSAVLAAGAAVTLSSAGEVLSWNNIPATDMPIYHLHGHSRSGCAFRPELVDLWAGGGAQLPDMV